MERKLFFWLEQLKITRVERRTIFILLLLLTCLVSINAVVRPSSPFDKTYYRKLDQQFLERSKVLAQQQKKRMAKYYPSLVPVPVAADTLPAGSQKSDTKKLAAKTKAPAAHALININTADVKALQSLPGIGPAYSKRIVDYRQQNGPFTSKDQLIKIKGIGKKRLAKLKPFIKLTVHK